MEVLYIENEINLQVFTHLHNIWLMFERELIVIFIYELS